MTKEQYDDAIRNGPGDRTCPFIQKDDHMEVENTTEFFDVVDNEYELKQIYKDIIEDNDYNTTVFIHEVEDGLDPIKCAQAVMAATDGDSNEI